MLVGSGTPLGEIDGLKANFSNTKAFTDAVSALHMLVFKSKGKSGQQRKKLKTFQGINYGDVGAEIGRERYFDRAMKQSKAIVTEMLTFLALDHTPSSFDDGENTKENMCNRLLDYLEEPKEVGKKRKGGKAGGPKAKKVKLSDLEKTLLTSIYKHSESADGVAEFVDGKLPKDAVAFVESLGAPEEEDMDDEDDEAPKKKKPAPAKKKKPAAKKNAAAPEDDEEEEGPDKEEDAEEDDEDKDEVAEDDDAPKDDDAKDDDGGLDDKEDDDDDKKDDDE